MFKRIAFIVIGLALIIFPLLISRPGIEADSVSPGVSTDWYVKPSGKDANGRGAAYAPLRTIQAAVDRALNGDTIHIMAGTYIESLAIPKNVTLKGVSGKAGDVIIRGETNVPAVSVIKLAGVTLKNLTIQNGRTGISLEAGGNAGIENCILHNNVESSISIIQGSVTIRDSIIRDAGIKGEKGIVINIIGNTIENCSKDAISLISSTAAVSRNIIRSNGGSGIYINGGGSANIENNLIVKNELFGIFCSGMNGRILNNTIADNGSGGVSDVNPPSGQQQVFNNIVVFNGRDYESSLNASYSDIGSGNLTGSHNISKDPEFVNRVMGDYHLQQGSPCIDAGANDGTSGEDLEGNPRIFNGTDTADMGCYEGASPGPTLKLRNDWYVSPRGSDTSGDGSRGKPLRSILVAIHQAASGNTIHILPGTYRENLRITRNLTLTGEGERPQDVVLDGRRNGPGIKVIDAKCRINNLTIQNSNGDGINSFTGSLALSNLVIRNSAWSGVRIRGTSSDRTANTIRDCTIANNLTGGIFTTSVYNTLIEKNSLIGNSNIGIGIDNGGADIGHNIIRDTQGDGIGGFESSLIITGNLIENNTGSGVGPIHNNARIIGNIIRGNAKNGIDYGLSSQDIINNLIVKNKQYGLRPGAGTVNVTNNTIADNTAGGIYDVSDMTPRPADRSFLNNVVVFNGQDFTSAINASYCDLGSGNLAGNHIISLDPKFVNAANGDYHLQIGSPCINTGSNNGAPADDLEGNQRPTNEIVDMGCYESALNQ